MIDDIIIVEDFISKKFQDDIENRLLRGKFPWWYQEDMTVGNAENSNKMGGFTHSLYMKYEWENPDWEYLAPVLTFAADKVGIHVKDVVTSKSALQLPIIQSAGKTHGVHVDLVFPHWVFLYYVTDSDGDTILYNEKGRNNQEIPEVLTERMRVTPKKGKGIFFNGSIFHTVVNPSQGHRCIINYDFIV